jgi:hypothetical protein
VGKIRKYLAFFVFFRKKSMTKGYRLFFILLFMLALFGAGYVFALYLSEKEKNENRIEESTILLEKIQSVAKMVTIEGYYSELYRYEDFWGYDWWIFRKKAIMRVKAKVSVGYDLNHLTFDLDKERWILNLRNVPSEPEIISIDHQIDYYDISQGSFNSFSEKDYNKIQKNAKEMIAKKAATGELMNKAKSKGLEMLDLIKFMAEGAGWKVEIDFLPPKENKNKLQ